MFARKQTSRIRCVGPVSTDRWLAFVLQVLLNKKEISGKEVEFILDNYPANTPTSLILAEKDPGSLSFSDQDKEQGHDLEYNMLSQ